MSAEQRAVIHYERPNFRSKKWDGVTDKTRQFLHLILDKKETLDIRIIELHFPERHMSLAETVFLWENMKKYCPNLKTVVIHSSLGRLVDILFHEGFESFQAKENYPESALQALSIDAILAEPYSDSLE